MDEILQMKKYQKGQELEGGGGEGITSMGVEG